MFSRLGDAVKDAAETLRRVFQDPAARTVALSLATRPAPPFAPLGVQALPGLAGFAPEPGPQRVAPEAVLQAPEVALRTCTRGESEWAAWSAGARVAVMPVFRSRQAGRLEVPPLPRRPRVQGMPAGGFGAPARRAFDPLPRPGPRGLSPAFAAPACRRGLDLALGLPVAVAGEDLRSAPRATQMRCSLQIVKATGENVRNLDLLGRYLIPRNGVREVRHDAASGRLLVLLGPEAAGSGRAPLLIARRKDDRSLLTCFAEEP